MVSVSYLCHLSDKLSIFVCVSGIDSEWTVSVAYLSSYSWL